jgi:phage/plasmid-associated DNA primase
VLYEAYKEWCKANGHGLKSSTRVSKEWERLGFKKTHTSDGNYWQGVAYRQPSIFDGKT